MLWEWALSLANPAPRRLHRLGYVRQSGLLHARSRRCRRAWAPHLDRAKAAAAEAAAATHGGGLAVVLGSGLLDDVPLDRLAARFARVRLVDAVHPWPARLAARRYANVDLITAEIGAGLADPCFAAACAGADLVISANLLSQLPIVPTDLYAARGREPPSALGPGIVAAHLDALDDLSRQIERVCLITDTLQREEDRAGRVIESLELLHGAKLPPPDSAWDWEIAPFGEVSRSYRLIHRVQSYRDWASARTQAIDPR